MIYLCLDLLMCLTGDSLGEISGSNASTALSSLSKSASTIYISDHVTNLT